MSQPLIQIRGQQLALIWKISQPQVSRISAPAKIDGARDFAIDLIKALDIRGIACSEEEFEAALRAGATSQAGDPVAVARDEAIYDLFYEWAPPVRQKNGMRAVTQDPKFKEKMEEKLLADKQAAEEALKREIKTADMPAPTIQVPDVPILSNADLLNRMRVEKLKIEAERSALKMKMESGEVIERAEVEAALVSAGAIVRSVLQDLPFQVSFLLSTIVAPEVEQTIFDKVQEKCDQALHAIQTAFVKEDDEGDLDIE